MRTAEAIVTDSSNDSHEGRNELKLIGIIGGLDIRVTDS